MKKISLSDRWVLVTGASSGLGRELARRLALEEGANLVISARRDKRLQALKEELEASSAQRIKPVVCDLALPDGPEQLFREATSVAPIYAVINNAGLTDYGVTHLSRVEIYDRMVMVNFRASMILSLRFLDYFQERGEGAILNVSSQGGYIPMPFQNVYGATKNALQSFTEGLREENRDSPVVISAVAPGGIDTEMFSRSGLIETLPRRSLFMMKPERAARKILAAFKRGQPVTVPGLMNKINHRAMYLFPRRLVVWFLGRLYRPGSKRGR